MQEQVSYIYIPHDNRLRLMAWVSYHGNNVRAEIANANADTRTAQINVPGWLYQHTVPFGAIQSVALYQGDQVIQAFGRPRADINEWVQYQEVMA